MSTMASENNFLIKEYNDFMLNVGSDEYTPKFGLNIFWKFLNTFLSTTKIYLNISKYLEFQFLKDIIVWFIFAKIV